MAGEATNRPDESDGAPTIAAGTSSARGMDVKRVVAHLAEQPASRNLLAESAEPTWDDVRTVMTSAGEPPHEPLSGTGDAPPASAFVTPQAFYAEVTRHEDVRELLRRLAE